MFRLRGEPREVKELGPLGLWPGVAHTSWEVQLEPARGIDLVVELIRRAYRHQRRIGSALARLRLGWPAAGRVAVRRAALHHEAARHTREEQPVVEATLGQSLDHGRSGRRHVIK